MKKHRRQVRFNACFFFAGKLKLWNWYEGSNLRDSKIVYENKHKLCFYWMFFTFLTTTQSSDKWPYITLPYKKWRFLYAVDTIKAKELCPSIIQLLWQEERLSLLTAHVQQLNEATGLMLFQETLVKSRPIEHEGYLVCQACGVPHPPVV